MFQNKLNKLSNLIQKIKSDINIPILSDFLDWFYDKIMLNFISTLPNLKINKGEIYFVNFGKNIWSELNKIRPWLAYSDYYFNNWETVIFLPLKSFKWKMNKNVNIFVKSDEINWLKKDSIVDISAIRQISKKRIKWYVWRINNDTLSKIDSKIKNLFWIKK